MINTELLRRLRIEHGLSQRRLAALAGVGPLVIKRLEDGADPADLTLRILGRIADALDVPTHELLTRHGQTGNVQPAAATPTPLPPIGIERPLDVNEARLLRRIHRGELVERHLSCTDRELTLPALLRRGLITTGHRGLGIAVDVKASLTWPRKSP